MKNKRHNRLIIVERGYRIQDELTDIPQAPQHHILPSEKDSTYFDYLIASLNYKEHFSFPVNAVLKGYVSEFIERLETELGVYFHTYRKMHDVIYAYVVCIRRRLKIDLLIILMMIS